MANIKYIPGLDGLRAISVTLVLVSHAGFGDIVPGGLGVTIFFFLSGYLITTLLLNEFERNATIHIPHFYARRFLRLFPPLVVSLIIAYSLLFLGLTTGKASVSGVLAQLFYFANYYGLFGPGDVPSGTGILWSLAVEEHFYLLYPLTFLVMRRYLSLKQTVVLFSVICLLVLIWRNVLVHVFAVSEYRTYYATDTRIDNIIYGCILAIWKNPIHYTGNFKTLRLKDYLILGAGVTALLASLLYREPKFRQTLRYSIQGLALLPIFYYTISRHLHPLFRWLNIEPLRKLGLYSYSIYLIHLVILIAISENGLSYGNSYLLLFETAVLSIFYAFVLYKYVDLPFAKWRRKLRD